jgi:hypothetical protein
VWTPAGASFGYQWLGDDVAIGGATGSTYTPVAGDVGTSVKVRVTASKAGSTPTTVTSEAVGPVKSPSLVNSAPPTISGTAKVGSRLTARSGTWAPAGATFGYQWLANGVAISGARATTYLPTARDLGRRISVKVSGSKVGFTSGTATSALTAAVARGTIVATRLPAISGQAKVGRTLTVSRGSWSPAGVVLTFQWYAGAKAIKGASKTTLKLTKATKGKKLLVKVTATTSGYTTSTVRTRATGKIT